jgi:hypothetical protein
MSQAAAAPNTGEPFVTGGKTAKATTKPVFTIVHPMRQIDDLQSINVRVEALINAAYDMLEQLDDGGRQMGGPAGSAFSQSAERGMTLLGLARDLLAQSQHGLSQEYHQLAELGVHKMEKAA